MNERREGKEGMGKDNLRRETREDLVGGEKSTYVFLDIYLPLFPLCPSSPVFRYFDSSSLGYALLVHSLVLVV